MRPAPFPRRRVRFAATRIRTDLEKRHLLSLKAFHIVFVVVATLLAVGFGVWAIRDYRATGETPSLIYGVLSLVCAAALLIYGRWFLRKLKNESYL